MQSVLRADRFPFRCRSSRIVEESTITARCCVQGFRLERARSIFEPTMARWDGVGTRESQYSTVASDRKLQSGADEQVLAEPGKLQAVTYSAPFAAFRTCKRKRWDEGDWRQPAGPGAALSRARIAAATREYGGHFGQLCKHRGRRSLAFAGQPATIRSLAANRLGSRAKHIRYG